MVFLGAMLSVIWKGRTLKATHKLFEVTWDDWMSFILWMKVHIEKGLDDHFFNEIYVKRFKEIEI